MGTGTRCSTGFQCNRVVCTHGSQTQRCVRITWRASNHADVQVPALETVCGLDVGRFKGAPGDRRLEASLGRWFARWCGGPAQGARAPLGGAAHSARRSARRAAAPPPPGGPRGVQRAGGGAPRPGHGVGLPGSLRRPDPAALVMLLVDADRPEPVRGGARELAVFLTPEPGAEVGDAAGSGGGGSRGCGRGDVQGRAPQQGSGRIGVGVPLSAEPGPGLPRSFFSYLALGLRGRTGGPGVPPRRRGGCPGSPRDARQVAPAPSSSQHGSQGPRLASHPYLSIPSPLSTPAPRPHRHPPGCQRQARREPMPFANPGPRGGRALVPPLPARSACSALS